MRGFYEKTVDFIMVYILEQLIYAFAISDNNRNRTYA